MQYFVIVVAVIVVFLLVLLLLTGCKISNLVGFFVEELDENNTPLHPVKLLAAAEQPEKAPAAPAQTAEEPAPPRRSAPPAARPNNSKPAPKRNHQPVPKQSVSKQGTKRSPNQIYNEMAILTHKIDERRRVVDSNGHSTLFDEYFELVFDTRRGETIRLVASRAAFKEIPFNQDGALTYKRGRFIRFKYQGGTVSDELPPAPNRQ